MQVQPKKIIVKLIIINICQFLKVCSSYIRNNYCGDPLGVHSFINSIKLLITISNNEHDDLLLQFVQTKLEGKALEILPEDPTLENIIETLKTKKKPDNSKVIAGKINALRADTMQMHEFAKQAEDLADALKRALISEGITIEKPMKWWLRKLSKCVENLHNQIW